MSSFGAVRLKFRRVEDLPEKELLLFASSSRFCWVVGRDGGRGWWDDGSISAC